MTRTTTMPPAVVAHAITVANQVKHNKQHAYCDPAKCQHAARMISYCSHGSFIGDPYGPDYMCGWCESGESPYAFGLHSAWTKQQAVVSAITTDLLRNARRADADGRPHVITAHDVYGRTFGGLVERQLWEWLTPHDLATVSVLITNLTAPKRAPAK